MGTSFIDNALDTADHARKSDTGVGLLEAADKIPGANIVSEGAQAGLDGLLMQRDLRDGHGWAAAEHGAGALFHGAMSAMNVVTGGEAGVAVHELLELVDDGGGEHSLADAARGKKEGYSYVDAARAGMHHDALNAVGGHR